MDSVGFLFQTLLDNDSSVDQYPFFNSNTHNPDPEDNPADKTPSSSPSDSPPPLVRKRTYNTVAKVPYSCFLRDPKYTSHAQFLMQDTEPQASKKPKATEPPCTISNIAGIPNISTSLQPEIQKTPSATRLLAGIIRMPKSQSLSASSSFSVGTPDDFQINVR